MCTVLVISIQSSAGFTWKCPYSSNLRRVSRENGHIHLIPGGFSVNMTILVQFPPGFAYIYTIFKSDSSGFAWHWSHPSNPRRVSQVTIQILSVFRRGEVGRKDIHQKTWQVSDTPNKRKSNFWSIQVGAYCIRPSMYRVDQSFVHDHGHSWGVCKTYLRTPSNPCRE